MSEVEKLDIMNARWELMKEMMITGDQRISTSWAIKNILILSREGFRKEKIKRIFDGE